MYEVTLVVTDSKSNSDEQEVTVKVTNVEEPGTIELSPLQPRVGFPVTATLTDPDNVTAGSVSWQWYRGNNIVTTSLPAECAETTDNNCAIKDAAADTYTPVADDIDDILTAVATYTDGSPNDGDAKDVMTGEAANAVLADTRNKAPVFPDQDMEMEGRQTAQERMIAENTASGTAIGDSVTATDSITANDGTKEPEQLTYSLGGPDAASFSINRADGQLSTKAALDKEVKDTYTVTVTATDPSGETDTATVTIKVMNEDEPPMIMVGGLAISGMSRVEYPENDTMPVATYTASGPDADMASWTLEGDDTGDFRISSAGVLTFRTTPDYESPADADGDNTYMVTVKANDGTYMDTHGVTVMVTNVDEAGTVSLSSRQPVVGTALTASVEDPDGMVTGETWQWASSDTSGGTYTNISGATSASYTPEAADANKYLRATARYTDAEGSGKSAKGVTAHSVAAGDPLLARYDTDQNGEISRTEVIAAINDYLFGAGANAITRDQAMAVINLYLFES